MDQAGVKYWDKVWSEGSLPTPIQVDPPTRHNYLERCFDAVFRRYLEEKTDAQLVEIGCARSVWLPFLANRYKVKVTGIDYSESGCEQSRQILRASNINGAIYQADVFKPPQELLNRFDFVTSFGVAEHFDPVSDCLSAMARLLKPGGVAITFVPSFSGICGRVQHFADRRVYSIHQILNAEKFESEHGRAGLNVLEVRSLVAMNLLVVNWGESSTRLKGKFGSRVSSAVSKLCWSALPKNSVSWQPGLLASHLVCVASKPSQ